MRLLNIMAREPVELKTSKKRSALRQIEAAIKHFHNGDLDIAITLAAAGEGQLPETTKEYLFRMLRRLAPNDDFNLFISWLKHPAGPENATIIEFEAVLVIARAIHKFVAVYGETCQSFIDFDKWATDNTILPRVLTDKEK
jgi:hypothetical protein